MEKNMRLYPAVGLMCVIWFFSIPISAQDLSSEDTHLFEAIRSFFIYPK